VYDGDVFTVFDDETVWVAVGCRAFDAGYRRECSQVSANRVFRGIDAALLSWELVNRVSRSPGCDYNPGGV